MAGYAFGFGNLVNDHSLPCCVPGSYSDPSGDPLQPHPLFQIWSLQKIKMAVATMPTPRLKNALDTEG